MVTRRLYLDPYSIPAHFARNVHVCDGFEASCFSATIEPVSGMGFSFFFFSFSFPERVARHDGDSAPGRFGTTRI